jgi:hypothetical protein
MEAAPTRANEEQFADHIIGEVEGRNSCASISLSSPGQARSESIFGAIFLLFEENQIFRVWFASNNL